MTRWLLDAVAFQHGAAAAAPWRALLPLLAAAPACRLLLLDRGGLPAVAGAEAIPFPAHRGHGAADSALIQQVCEQHDVQVFTSTGSTTPLAVPTVLLLPHAAPGFDAGDAEAELAVSFAQHYVCTDARTRDALRALYAEIPAGQISLPADGTPAALAAALLAGGERAATQARSGQYAAFFEQWRRLRGVQAAVEWA